MSLISSVACSCTVAWSWAFFPRNLSSIDLWFILHLGIEWIFKVDTLFWFLFEDISFCWLRLIRTWGSWLCVWTLFSRVNGTSIVFVIHCSRFSYLCAYWRPLFSFERIFAVKFINSSILLTTLLLYKYDQAPFLLYENDPVVHE